LLVARLVASEQRPHTPMSDEENHNDFLETQRDLVAKIGIEL
jgi:bacterioferritin (cytochrome b1)